MPEHPLHAPVLGWYAATARDLPWRAETRTPWGVLVSEFMLQQTPVSRVLPMWREWLDRWPTPTDLAAASPADAVRAWGRLGYPRRALRLHQTATALVADHGGQVPEDEAMLRQLPGIGEYTAAAVMAFGFGRRAVVLDTNVRRVLARVCLGEAMPGPTPTRAERDHALTLLPDEDARAAEWSVAVMELGALVCTARGPVCEACPLAEQCRWLAAGRPAAQAPRKRSPGFEGTDRQVRGRLLAVLRDAEEPVPPRRLDAVWPDEQQRQRALRSLLADGLVQSHADGTFTLPLGA